MGDVIGSGTARNLVDRDGDALDDGDGYLKVKLAADSASINIGDIQLLSGDNAGANVIGTVLISGGTTPTTFNTVETKEITCPANTQWNQLPSVAGSEMQLQSASTNVDIVYVSSDDDDEAGVELLPSTSIALPISNSDLLGIKLSAGTAGQKLYLLMLSNTE